MLLKELNNLLESNQSLFNELKDLLAEHQKKIASKATKGSSHSIGGNFNAVLSGNVRLRNDFIEHGYGSNIRWDLILEIGNDIEGGGLDHATKVYKDILREMAETPNKKLTDNTTLFMTDNEEVAIAYEYARSFCWVGIRRVK